MKLVDQHFTFEKLDKWLSQASCMKMFMPDCCSSRGEQGRKKGARGERYEG